ncbi:naringenin 8-dimethylallyltransferase 2, chloroplastic-like [Arachis ipaensis]|uniref:naringenin 8-dimethylallyltransferase 2, chloroplastic-like n=1 Tax=Arachis ipaensis TaxID=130454 RepID=UPI000A2B5A1E|nr:naringenin 8-dimethylallyltransferase 2, chloroplastic-like [Arachis ipaensis]
MAEEQNNARRTIGDYNTPTSESCGDRIVRSMVQTNNFEVQWDQFGGYYVPRSSWNKNGKSLTENRIINTSLENNWTNHYKGIEQKSTFDKYEKRQIINAVTTESYEPESQAHNSKIIIESIIHGLDTFRKFSRFYAFMSQVAGSLFSSLLAVDNLSQLYPTFFNGYLQYIVPHFFMHLYLVGLNQLADLEIDKANACA